MWPRMLNGTLVVYGADLEALAWQTVRRSGLKLAPHKEEEYVAELIFEAWTISHRHDEDTHPGKFGRGLVRLLPLRLVDIVRREEGRTNWQFSPEVHADHEREARRTVTDSLDLDPWAKPGGAWDMANPGVSLVSQHDRLGGALSEGTMDPAADSPASLLRALNSRDSREAEPNERIRKGRKGRAGPDAPGSGRVRRAA